MPSSRHGAPRRRLRRRSGGFSILELAIVLALITTAAAIAIPLFYGRASITLDNAAILLARDLRAAQNQAVLIGQDVVVEFFPDGDGYRVLDSGGEVIQSPTSDGDFERRYSRDGVFNGVSLHVVELSGRQEAQFTCEGFALYGGTLRLEYGGESRELRFEAPNGLVTVEGLDRGWFDEGE